MDEEFFEDLEEMLILSDVGVHVATTLTEELRYEAKLENAKKPDALKRVIVEKLVDIYEKDGRYNEAINYQDGLTVMLFVGVNGVGKTTSIGKLAYRYKQEGKKVHVGGSRYLPSRGCGSASRMGTPSRCASHYWP
ncbi:SRP54-type, GTPase domain protein [Streptococcus pyogenes MGAS2111]|nr:SRP54-type, GTPase domain protein [Streptococcus pyogenes MGAS2111]